MDFAKIQDALSEILRLIQNFLELVGTFAAGFKKTYAFETEAAADAETPAETDD